MRMVFGLLACLPLLAGFAKKEISGVKVQANSPVAMNVLLDALQTTVTVVETDKPIMTNAAPLFTREAITSLPGLDVENAAESLRLDFSLIEAEALIERLHLSPAQASRIRGILQARQARLVSIDREASLSPPARRKQIATVVNETDAAIRKVLRRSQRREYPVVSRKFTVN